MLLTYQLKIANPIYNGKKLMPNFFDKKYESL